MVDFIDELCVAALVVPASVRKHLRLLAGIPADHASIRAKAGVLKNRIE
jgi:hypothetical protein